MTTTITILLILGIGVLTYLWAAWADRRRP